jgi:predicted lysophospholipase L1 biosynthesis ABC-type transport system permease subunit
MVFGRLLPGTSLAAARADLGAVVARLAALYPEANRGYGVRVESLRREIPGPTDRKLFALVQGAIALLLLIACANVANLLVARGFDRRRELALRASLGAGRGRTLRQLLAESALLGLAASAVGCCSRRRWCASCGTRSPAPSAGRCCRRSTCRCWR